MQVCPHLGLALGSYHSQGSFLQATLERPACQGAKAMLMLRDPGGRCCRHPAWQTSADTQLHAGLPETLDVGSPDSSNMIREQEASGLSPGSGSKCQCNPI